MMIITFLFFNYHFPNNKFTLCKILQFFFESLNWCCQIRSESNIMQFNMGSDIVIYSTPSIPKMSILKLQTDLEI